MAKEGKPTGKPQAPSTPAPEKPEPRLERFYRVRRLDTFNFVIEMIEVAPGVAAKVTQPFKPDVKRLVMARLEALLWA